MKSGEIPAVAVRWLDELYAMLFGSPTPKGGECMTCPNCEADMEYDEETGTWECPECHYTEKRD